MFVAIVFTLRCLLSDTVLFAFCQPEGIAEIRRSQNARFESDLLVDWVIELQAHWKKGAHKKRNKRKNKKTKEKNLVITHTFLFFFFFFFCSQACSGTEQGARQQTQGRHWSADEGASRFAVERKKNKLRFRW